MEYIYIDEWVEKYRAGTVSAMLSDDSHTPKKDEPFIFRPGYDEIVKEIRMGNIDLTM